MGMPSFNNQLLAIAAIAVASLSRMELKAGIVTVKVENGMDTGRKHEMVELPWPDISSKLPGIATDAVSVKDDQGRDITCQVVASDGPASPALLIFQTDFAPRQARLFKIIDQAPAVKAVTLVNAMFYPERKDDFNWENDRMAFRMYGPALMRHAGPQSGVDIWCKHVPDLVAVAMYEKEKKGISSYHKDDGRSLDAYSVDKSMGCGGTAVWQNGKLCQSNNFISSRVLANGPLRAVFELTYEAWTADNVSVSETKKISIDAGSQLNRFESQFTFSGTDSIAVAAGIVIHPEGKPKLNAEAGWAAEWEKTDGPDNGMLGLGIVPNIPKLEFCEAAGHILAVAQVKSGEAIIYYAGAGWSKRDFDTPMVWYGYLTDFTNKLLSPLKISWL